MGMKFSRHARNHLKLYKIDLKDIASAVNDPDDFELRDDKSIAIKYFTGKYSGYPLKVIYDGSGGAVFVITVYPLKKKLWGEI